MELQSETRSKIAKAMIAARKEIHGATKNSNGNWGSYASAEDLINCCMNPLLDHGVLLTQGTIPMDDKNWVVTQATHESGEFLRSYTEIKIQKENDPQKALAGQTYARRAGIEALLCIPRVDDDGENKVVKPAMEPVVEPTTSEDDKEHHPVPEQDLVTSEEQDDFIQHVIDSGVSTAQAKELLAKNNINSSAEIPKKKLGLLRKAVTTIANDMEEVAHA
tara:strand:- start:388 stop:1047 length:660 start_codon:yes stop_codon:yes gene_type:complete